MVDASSGMELKPRLAMLLTHGGWDRRYSSTSGGVP